MSPSLKSVRKKTESDQKPTVACTLWEFLRYFLWLGTFGFGGPIALVGYMQRDLVERKRWVSESDYLHGLALSQLCPGPLAAQLAIYLGWIRSGIFGATLVAIAFVLPSFLMVLGISVLYVHFGSLFWMQGAFYGIGASVIAIIARSSVKLAKMTINKDYLLIMVCIVNLAITAWLAAEIVWVIVLSGIGVMLIKAPPKFSNKANPHVLLVFPQLLITGIQGVASHDTLIKILAYFAWAGTFVFGSGLAIVPFLHSGVVEKYHWLTEREFLDAVAVALITPGPVVITVAFIGYLVGGLVGALLAAIGVFIPCYGFVIILAPYYHKIVKNRSVLAFVKGITAAVAGAIGGAVFILGKQAITDAQTIAIFLITCLLLFFIKKIPEPLLIVASGFFGILLKSYT